MCINARIFMSLAVLGLVVTSCGSRQALMAISSDERVVVDVEDVPTSGNLSLLDLLRRTLTAARLGESAPPDAGPLVIVDGIVLTGGARSLDDIPAFHAASVTTMRGVEAVPVHGPRATSGAIIVATKRGRRVTR